MARLGLGVGVLLLLATLLIAAYFEFFEFFSPVEGDIFHNDVELANNIKSRLESALTISTGSIQTLHEQWKIDQFPKFLEGVSMSSTSWEILRLKFEEKIIQSLIHLSSNNSNSNDVAFVFSFMGSSVTAGHDSLMNRTTSILLGSIMKPTFAALGIKAISRSGAIGNNPCMPYDLCPRAFAGIDADLIQWEQSYNCFFGAKEKPLYEHFIRQALLLQNHPVIIFSDSETPNWSEDDCKAIRNDAPVTILSKEKQLLSSLNTNPNKISTQLNTVDMGVVLDLSRSYPAAGIQMWKHNHYEEYKCKGPYIAKWGCCSAPWHPSLKGHEFRASHFAYTWLLILREAIKSVLSGDGRLNLQQQKVTKKLTELKKLVPSKPVTDSTFPSGPLQCLTSFEPNYDKKHSGLENFILGINSNSSSYLDKKPFLKVSIDEHMQISQGNSKPEILVQHRARGYLDYKYTYYGNQHSIPLSIKAEISAPGYAFICEPPGWWGKLPPGWSRLWVAPVKMYLTSNIANYDEFLFDVHAASIIEYFQSTPYGVNRPSKNPLDGQELCAQTKKMLPAGRHVLTIVPQTDEFVGISTILFPA